MIGSRPWLPESSADRAGSPVADEPAGPDPASTLRSRSFVAVLVLAAIVGVIASLAAWCFLELIFYIQQWVFTDIPHDVGFDHGAPLWWYLPVLAIAGVIAAFAIARLPGNGGHVPAEGLKASPPSPSTFPACCWRPSPRSDSGWWSAQRHP